MAINALNTISLAKSPCCFYTISRGAVTLMFWFWLSILQKIVYRACLTSPIHVEIQEIFAKESANHEILRQYTLQRPASSHTEDQPNFRSRSSVSRLLSSKANFCSNSPMVFMLLWKPSRIPHTYIRNSLCT